MKALIGVITPLIILILLGATNLSSPDALFTIKGQVKNNILSPVTVCGAPGARSILALIDTTRQIAPLLTNLGNYKMIVTTNNAKAQQFFSQGINLYYGFNHMEAYRSFMEAARLDPQFAMAYWGQALSLGPNINLPMDPADAGTVYKAIQKAISLYDNYPLREKSLIDAVAKRYTENPPDDRKALDEAYAGAMKEAALKFPNDPDVLTLFAEALMDLHPWDFYKNGVPQPWTEEPVNTIAKVLAKNPRHPGANHLNIHIREASSAPGNATASADRLRNLVPGSGHLVHMPSHIYIRTGRYLDGIIANEKAVQVDKDYIEQCKIQGVYPLFYYPHNYHFLWACTQMSGQSAKSLAVAQLLVKNTNSELMGEKDYAGLQHWYAAPWYTMVRFGKWEEILKSPAPADSLLYAKSVWHYARGMALLRTNKTTDALHELENLKTLVALPEMKILNIGGFNTFDKVLGISVLVLEAEIHANGEHYPEAVELLKQAIEMEDNLLYQEPPDWFLPVRQILGAVLLKSNQTSEAEVAFRKDLTIYPQNGWSLFGLYKSLEAQGKTGEASKIKRQFNKAFSQSDVVLASSVF